MPTRSVLSQQRSALSDQRAAGSIGSSGLLLRPRPLPPRPSLLRLIVPILQRARSEVAAAKSEGEAERNRQRSYEAGEQRRDQIGRDSELIDRDDDRERPHRRPHHVR